MKRPGAVALSEVAARTSHIEIACTRCERRGRYRISRLVERLGPDFAMTDLAAEIADCPRRGLSAWSERCDVYFPGLAELMAAPDQRPNQSLSTMTTTEPCLLIRISSQAFNGL
jgi:hypothetical protein